MKKDNNHFLPGGDKDKKFIPALTIEYRVLGTIPIDELFHAIWEDFQVLKEVHNVEFVTAAKLRLPVTDGYGQPLTVRRQNGGTMHMMHTYHHKPACKDYDL